MGGMRHSPRSSTSDRALDLAELYRRERSFVRACLRSFGVPVAGLDDATHDVFVVVHRRLGDFDRARGTTRAWLFGIGLRVARAHRRSLGRTCPISNELRAEAAFADPERYVSHLRAAQLADRILGSLPQEQWTVLVMADVEGMTGPEIAQTLGLRLKTVYTRLGRARAKIRRRAKGTARHRWLAWVGARLDVASRQRSALASAAFVSVRVMRALVVAAGVLLAVGVATMLRPGSDRSVPEDDRPQELERSGPTLHRASADAAEPSRPPVGRTSSVGGTVTSDRGTSMHGATVCAWPEAEILTKTARTEPRCVRAEGGGRYRLTGLIAGRRYRVTAAAERHEPAQWVGPDGSTQLRLRPDEQRRGIDIIARAGGVRIEGRIVDVTGGPIDQATVALVDTHDVDWSSAWGARPPARVRTDEHGAFHAWVARGSVQLFAYAAGYASAQVTTHAPGPTVTLALAPESAIVGVVVDSEGSPVAGAQVGLDGWDPRGVVPVHTDSGGAFRLTGLPPGRYRLVATAAGLTGRSPSSVLLGVAESVSDVVIEVAPAARFVARVVVEGSGASCPRGSVTLSSEQVRGVPRLLDREGVAHFDAVLPGTYRVLVFCEGHVSAPFPPQTVSGEDIDQTYVVAAGLTLRGHVVDGGGQGVVGAWVRGHGTSQGAAPFVFDVETSEDGSFVVEGLSVGAYTLEATADDGRTSSPMSATMTESGADDVELRFDASGTLEGIVRTADGDPVAGALVIVGGGSPKDRRAWTTDDGRFRFDELRAEPSLVRAGRDEDDPFEPVAVEIASGATADVELVLEPRGGRITGVVLDPSGAPVADAIVVSGRQGAALDMDEAVAVADLRQRGQGWRGTLPTITGDDGRFELTDLPAGSHVVLAFRRGGGDAWLSGVAVGDDIELELLEPTGLRGVVFTPEGTEPTMMSVRLRGTDNSYRQVESFHGQGSFRFDELDPGRYALRIQAREGVAEISATVGPDDDERITVTLSPWIRLEGHFVDLETGEPVPDVFAISGAGDLSMEEFAVKFEHALMAKDSVRRSDGRGRFVIDDARPGDLHLLVLPAQLLASRYDWMRVVAEVEPGTQALTPISLVVKRLEVGAKPGDFGFSTTETNFCSHSHVISQLDPDGAATRAGLRPGDEIVAIDGHDVAGRRCYLVVSLLTVPPGGEVTLTLADGRVVPLVAR